MNFNRKKVLNAKVGLPFFLATSSTFFVTLCFVFQDVAIGEDITIPPPKNGILQGLNCP